MKNETDNNVYRVKCPERTVTIMNKVVLMGRLTKNPEIKYAGKDNDMAVARYTLAVNRRYKRDGEQEADFISCVIFGKSAEFAQKYLHKGMRIVIGGRISTGSYKDKDGKTIYTTDTKEYLLLIDDPVSSFDMENKTGIMSFLRYQLGKFLLGNEYTKSIIMTHDLLTYYDSEKMFGELIEASKVKYGGDKPVYKRYELKNKILIPFPHNGRQEYTELMKIVYRFALGDADEYELVIGNIMRQVLEAFSTFQYKKGIEEVSTDRSILAILPEKEYQSYFENLMYRLILNNGSHRLDQTRSMSDMNFFTVISDSEKKRTAKEILCFIYLLNEKHVLAHLDGCSNVQSNLSKWCNDVKNKVGA